MKFKVIIGAKNKQSLVMYYKENGIVKHKSFCVISDELHHDVTIVYQIQAVFLTYIKACRPKVSKVEYFPDGCAAQYKNKYRIYSNNRLPRIIAPPN